MNQRARLIKELEQASDTLVQEVLDFLLLTKNKPQSNLEFSAQVSTSDREITSKSQPSLKDLLLDTPNLGEDTDFERRLDQGRDIAL